MNTRVWHKVARLPQSYLLLGGLGIGYAALIGWAGARWLVVGGGGLVSLSMVGAWIRQVNQITPSANLLDASVFQDQIWSYQSQVPATAKSTWDQAVQLAQSAQETAAQISERYPDAISELLQILYSLVALLEQIAKSTQALGQLETSTYQQATEERLQASLQGLHNTQTQLRSLHDQLVVSNLDPTLAGQTVALPLHLQELADTNKAILQMNSPAQLKR